MCSVSRLFLNSHILYLGGGGGGGGLGGLRRGERLLIMAYTGRLCPKAGRSLRIDHSKFFSTFDMDKLKKLLEMNALKLVKLPCLKMIC